MNFPIKSVRKGLLASMDFGYSCGIQEIYRLNDSKGKFGSYCIYIKLKCPKAQSYHSKFSVETVSIFSNLSQKGFCIIQSKEGAASFLPSLMVNISPSRRLSYFTLFLYVGKVPSSLLRRVGVGQLQCLDSQTVFN